MACFVFPTASAAEACQEFLHSRRSGNTSNGPITIRKVDFDVDQPAMFSTEKDFVSILRLYALFCPLEIGPHAMSFWRLAGTGISSRLAEQCLKHLDDARDASDSYAELTLGAVGSLAYDNLCQRIAYLLNRAPVDTRIHVQVSATDVLLYQTGMSAIYHAHQVLLDWRGSESIVFGFPYELTLKMIETYGPSCKFYGFGTEEELSQLEDYLKEEKDAGRMVQAVWCECASNPLLRTVDLDRIRKLADEYGFLVIVDETIGNFANVDVLGVADIVVTSLTKSFSGWTDVMAGRSVFGTYRVVFMLIGCGLSIVINPASRFHAELKSRFKSSWRTTNGLYAGDLIQLEKNSRDFLPRTAQANATASYLVDYLHPKIANLRSTITAVYYPKICWSVKNYRARMRPPKEEFAPGYGGLFTIEFESIKAARTFFDHLNVHKGPSLGANMTLAQPYTQTVFWKEQAWAAKYGLMKTIVRISVGYEESAALLSAFKYAIEKADEIKTSS